MSKNQVPTGTFESFKYAFSSAERLRTEVLASMVVGLALIPEAIAFSVIVGVDPRMGLFASFTIATVIAFTGGRPAMISAATGAVAVVVAPLTREHGVEYLLATILLAGILQVALAFIGMAKLMRFIPRSVMTGFINALAIVVFVAQLPQLIDVPWLVYPLVATGILMVILIPRFTRTIPAPLITIIVLTTFVALTHWNVPTVSDQGELPTSLPHFHLAHVPFTVDTLRIIFPTAIAVALVGLIESLMTAKLIDDITESHSDKTRENWGQGVANIVTSLFGGMGGCAVIGQSMINVKESGARTRFSTLLAGIFLLILSVALGDIVGKIPMAALVAVMIMVAFGTFDWRSVSPRTLRVMPISETLIMLTTVIGTLTINLAAGVGLGIVVAMIAFARRMSHIATVEMSHELTEDDNRLTRVYAVSGQLFFASSNDLVYSFDYSDNADHIVIDLSEAEIWDASTVATFDAIRQKFESRGKTLEFTGLDGASLRRLERLSGLHD